MSATVVLQDNNINFITHYQGGKMMKKKFKKLVALGLAAVLALGIVACGSGDENKDKENQSGTQIGSGQNTGDMEGKSWEEVLAEMPAELRGTSITIYNWNPISEYQGATAVIEEFTRQTGIEVEWKTENYDTYLSKLNSMVASGEAPDVVRTLTPMATGLLSLQPLSVTGYDFDDSAWDSWVKDVYTIGGETYAIRLKNTPLSSPAMLIYNKSLIEKYDLDDPYMLWKRGQWTYEKFVEIMKDFKSESGSEFAASMNGYSYLTSIWGVNGPVGFDGTQYVSNLGNSEYITAVQKVADLYNTDHLITKWAADEFDAGEVLFFGAGAIFARSQNAYLAKQKTAGNVNLVPFPIPEGQEKEYSVHMEVEAYGIPKGAKNAAAVPYFLRFFMDSTNYDMESYFGGTQGLEVYEYCQGIENKLWYDSGSSSYYGSDEDTFDKKLISTPGAQIISVIDSEGPTLEQKIKQLNEQLGKIGK